MDISYKKIKFTFFIAVFSVLVTQAQVDYVATKSAKESLQFAQSYYSQGALQKARRQLLHTIKIKDNFAIAHRLLGKVYLDLEEYEAAIQAFEQSFELDDKLSRAAFFECAEAYYMENEITLAQHYFSRFKEMKGQRYANANKESALEVEYDDKLHLREQNILFINQLDSSYKDVKINHLGNNINSKYDEYLPSITSDGQNLLFTRNSKRGDENIFLSKNKNGTWAASHMIEGDLNTPNNEGMAKFEAADNVFYFAGCKRESGDGGCDIYQAAFIDGKVTEVTPMEGRLNSFYWDSQPSISCDGKSLYFASTREGGFGGSDIWVSHRTATGEWGIPQNLGPSINTPSDEEAPFIATDGISLYFTSDGHLGQGNGDIFVSYFENNEWSLPDNLGYPVNSPAKELGIYIQGDNQTAYFGSSRKGGLGGLDIYQVQLPELFRPLPMVQLEGFVHDKETGEPIQTHVKIGHNGNTWEADTHENGWFFICLAGDQGYSFQIHQSGYQPYIDAVYLSPQDNRNNQIIQIQLEKEANPAQKQTYMGEERLTKTIVQIYFEFDSAVINPKGLSKLEKISHLINKYEDWTVQVVGFADNIGNEDYNQQLSQQRADEVVRFLKEKTSTRIATNINVVGKGATGAQDNEASRKKSRRVDVVLTR